MLMLQLVATALDAAKRAGTIIRAVLSDGNLRQVQKGEDDPQTEADRQAQVLLVSAFLSKWPTIKVVGEEGGLGHTEYTKKAIDADLDSSVMAEKCPENLGNITLEDVVVWIDPLDGTKEFTQGVVSAVTVLVGIAVRGQAVGGVVYQPFHSKTNDGYTGRAVWGITGLGAFGYTPCARTRSGLYISTTRSHATKELEKAIEYLSPEKVIRVGGAGNKVIQLLEGESDAYVFPTPGTKKWDTCGPEAVLRAAGGILTDKEGTQYEYGCTKDSDIPNSKGILAALDSTLHTRCLTQLRRAHSLLV